MRASGQQAGCGKMCQILPLQPCQITNSAEEFWGEVSKYKNAAGEVAFINIIKLAIFRSVPFSIMSVVKNKHVTACLPQRPQQLVI